MSINPTVKPLKIENYEWLQKMQQNVHYKFSLLIFSFLMSLIEKNATSRCPITYFLDSRRQSIGKQATCWQGALLSHFLSSPWSNRPPANSWDLMVRHAAYRRNLSPHNKWIWGYRLNPAMIQLLHFLSWLIKTRSKQTMVLHFSIPKESKTFFIFWVVAEISRFSYLSLRNLQKFCKNLGVKDFDKTFTVTFYNCGLQFDNSSKSFWPEVHQK